MLLMLLLLFMGGSVAGILTVAGVLTVATSFNLTLDPLAPAIFALIDLETFFNDTIVSQFFLSDLPFKDVGKYNISTDKNERYENALIDI